MTDVEPGSERWNWLAEGNAKQARKRVAVDILLRDSGGRVLLVNPTYKNDWDLPGGMSEANESPRQTVRRELSEELKIDIVPGTLLTMDWIAPHGPWDDLISMVFDGGKLDPSTVSSIELDGDELTDFAFFESDDARLKLRKYVGDRLARAEACLSDGIMRYREVYLNAEEE